jgi:hypothetical protein
MAGAPVAKARAADHQQRICSMVKAHRPASTRQTHQTRQTSLVPAGLVFTALLYTTIRLIARRNGPPKYGLPRPLRLGHGRAF